MSSSLQPFFPEARDPSLSRTVEVLKYRDSRRPVTLEMARTWCQESPSDFVMDMVVHSRQFLPGPEFYELIGEQWSAATSLWRSASLLRYHLGNAAPRSLALAMTKEERKFHAQLPEEFTVYRGCHHNNAHGISWSLDRRIAAQFPNSHRFRKEAPAVLVEAQVRRGQCLLKLGRSMLEVIAWEPVLVGAELLESRSH